MSTDIEEVFGPGTWMIGAGNMGQALIAGWHGAGLSTRAMTVIDPRRPPLPDGRQASAAPPDQGVPDLVVLAIKPQALDQVAQALAPRLGRGTRMISILAGTSTQRLRDALGIAQVVRVMPNLSAAVGKSATSAYAPADGEGDFRTLVDSLMARVGLVEWLALEELLDAATALAGCGPAFVFRFVDAMAAAACELGLAEDQARRMAIAVAVGASETLMRDGRDPAQLVEAVASEGGATRAGLDLLDAGDELGQLLLRTLEASTRRSQELNRL